MLSDDQYGVVEKVAKESGFRDFTVSVQSGSKKGDNYLGSIFTITVKEKDGSKEKSLILKCALESEQVRAQMPINDCYKREVYLYNTVLPAFVKLQEKHPVCMSFRAFAKIYGFSLSEEKEWLLLENITTRGFKMLNRKVTMNGDHVSMVLSELGKLHSLSFVMKCLEPDQYQELKSNLKNYFKDYPHIINYGLESIKAKAKIGYKAVEGNEEATEGLKRWETVIHILLEEIENEENMVITHGDPWCNNMMFKYSDATNPTKPTELCFLDWQISKMASPIIDLCYFLFLCASKEVLDNHTSYLRQYYQVLDQNLSAVGLNIEKLFPYSVFEDNFKKYCKVVLYIVIGMINNLLKDEKDALTFSDMAEDGGDVFKTFSSQGGDQSEQSYTRIRNIILMLVENKYI